MDVKGLMQLPVFQEMDLVAGEGGLHRRVFWAHVVDLPDAVDWMRPGDMLLATGSAWPKDAEWEEAFVQAAHEKGLAGLVVATGRFVDEVPEAMRKAADKWDVPVFDCPFRIPFVEVIESVGKAVAQEQAEILQRSEAIHRALTEAALHAQSLTDLLHVLAGLIGKRVVIESVERQILARVNPYATEAVAEEHGSEDFDEDGGVPIPLPPDWNNLSHPVRIAANDDPRTEACILCPIRVGQEVHGFLWVFEGETALSDLDIRAAEHGATVAALHLLRHQAVSRVNLTVQSTFLDTLLSGGRESTHVREQAQMLGFNLSRSYTMGIAILLQPDQATVFRPLQTASEFHIRERLGHLIRSWLSHVGQTPLISYSMNQVLFPLAIEFPTQLEQISNSLWKRLGERFRRHVMLAFGSVQYGADGIRDSFREARITASLVPPKSGIMRYDDYRLAQLLSFIPREELVQWASRTLEVVARSNSAEPFLETLAALVENGFNQNKTAEALVIHKNTLRYRLRRIEELLGRSISDNMLQHELVIAHMARKVLAATT